MTYSKTVGALFIKSVILSDVIYTVLLVLKSQVCEEEQGLFGHCRKRRFQKQRQKKGVEGKIIEHGDCTHMHDWCDDCFDPSL